MPEVVKYERHGDISLNTGSLTIFLENTPAKTLMGKIILLWKTFKLFPLLVNHFAIGTILVL